MTFTRLFSGVSPEDLPDEMTDTVDVDLRRRGETWDEEKFEPLAPDLPDAGEERRRKWRANEVDREEATRLFEETRAQL
jgi:hypothetical protein